MSASFVKKLDLVPNLLDEVCVVSLPLGENLTSLFSFKTVLVKIVGRELPVYLIVLEMVNYDVILGMDWLSKYNAIIFCRRKKVCSNHLKKKLLSIKAHL